MYGYILYRIQFESWYVCILKPYILLILWTKTCIHSLESKVSRYYNNNIVLNNVFSIILLTFSAWKVMKLLLVWPVVPEISNNRHYKSFHSLNLQFLNYKISIFWLWAYQRKIISETCHNITNIMLSGVLSSNSTTYLPAAIHFRVLLLWPS